MNQPLASTEIQAQVEIGIGHVALVNERFHGPIDLHERSPAYHHLQLALMPIRRSSMTCYTDRWHAHRYEPMGDLFILPAASLSHIMAWCEVQRSVVCHLDPDAAKGWLGDDFVWTDCNLTRSLNITSPAVRRLLCHVAAELDDPGHASETMIEALVTQACVELSRYLRNQNEHGIKGGLAPWRMQIVEEEVARDPGRSSVEAIAQKCGLSVRQLSRAFRASRGQTLADFIGYQRIKVAKDLLRDGATVKQAAYAGGFSAPSNFATAFQREVGCTPRTFRARYAS